MNKDKWTQQLHDKLADREVAAPDDLWADIEAALPKTPIEKGKRHSLFIPIRRLAVAASVAALVAGGGYLWWRGNPEEPLLSENSEFSVVMGAGSKATDRRPKVGNQGSASGVCPRGGSSTLWLTPKPRLAGYLKSKKPQTQPDVSIAESLAQQISQPEQTLQSAPETARPKEEIKEEKSVEEIAHQLNQQIAMLTPKENRRTIVSLYAANGLSDYQGANSVRMSDELAARYDISSYMPASGVRTRAAGNIIYLVGYEEKQKHYQPISFGLSVDYQLSSWLSLSTGVAYTRLRSDFTNVMKTMSVSRRQTLHYLGVPLNARFHVWHSGSLNVYLSAGGAADYNIKAQMTSEGVAQQMNRDRWQFSLQSGAGIEYDVWPQLGIYAEPGVKYYFDNGSAVNNFFKDKPLNFNLQVGLRIRIR